MFETIDSERVTLIRGWGELARAELSAIASLSAQARSAGRLVVIDLEKVTHLHYAGAAPLWAVPGLRAAGASRYVRSLVYAGGAAGSVELYGDVEEALRAA
jgi:hypothetical protein